jgi:hypothetical protein
MVGRVWESPWLSLLALAVAMRRRRGVFIAISLAVAWVFATPSVAGGPGGQPPALIALAAAAGLCIASLLFCPLAVLWKVMRGGR